MKNKKNKKIARPNMSRFSESSNDEKCTSEKSNSSSDTFLMGSETKLKRTSESSTGDKSSSSKSTASSLDPNSTTDDSKSVDSLDDDGGKYEEIVDSYCHASFSIKEEYVGRLLGKKGKNLKIMKTKFNVSPGIVASPKEGKKMCTLKGTESDINECLDYLEGMFPQRQFPDEHESLDESKLFEIRCANRISVHPPVDSIFRVTITSVIEVNTFYAQLPDHPSHLQYEFVRKTLSEEYGDDKETEQIPFPSASGSKCVAFHNNEWQRCEVMRCSENSVKLFLMDVGGEIESDPKNVMKMVKSLSKIHCLCLQFYLNGILPVVEKRHEALDFVCNFMEKYPLEAIIVGTEMSRDIPIVELFGIIDVNKIQNIKPPLVERGLAHLCNQNISSNYYQTAGLCV